MFDRLRSSARPVLLFSGVLLAACGDSPTGPPPDFDAQEMQATVEDVTAGMQEDNETLISLRLIAESLGSGHVAAMALSAERLGLAQPGPERSEDLEDAAALHRFRSLRAVLAAEDSALPDSLLGRTLVYDPEAAEYVIDDSRPGAPENGARFVIYQIDPLTRRPAEPLQEVGHVDLVDQSATDGLALRVTAVSFAGDQPETLADYTLEASFPEPGGVSVSFSAIGFLSDGAGRLDFDISHEVAVSEATEAIEIAGSSSYTRSPEGITLTVEVDLGQDVSSGIGLGTMELTLTDGSDTLVLSLALEDDGELEGSITVNGREAILIGGTTAEPTFTRPDGTDLPEADAQALRSLFVSVALLAFFPTVLVFPFAA